MPLLLLLPSLGLAATLSVDPNSSVAYATIQDAMNVAGSGDRIEVAAGSYRACITYGGKRGTRLRGFTLPNNGRRAIILEIQQSGTQTPRIRLERAFPPAFRHAGAPESKACAIARPRKKREEAAGVSRTHTGDRLGPAQIRAVFSGCGGLPRDQGTTRRRSTVFQTQLCARFGDTGAGQQKKEGKHPPHCRLPVRRRQQTPAIQREVVPDQATAKSDSKPRASRTVTAWEIKSFPWSRSSSISARVRSGPRL